MSTLYPTAPKAREDAEASLSVDVGFAALPDGPTKARPRHVVVSLLTDSGFPVEAHLADDDPLLPGVLARRSARVRAVGEGAVLPEPAHDPRTPTSALRDDVAPAFTHILEDPA